MGYSYTPLDGHYYTCSLNKSFGKTKYFVRIRCIGIDSQTDICNNQYSEIKIILLPMFTVYNFTRRDFIMSIDISEAARRMDSAISGAIPRKIGRDYRQERRRGLDILADKHPLVYVRNMHHLASHYSKYDFSQDGLDIDHNERSPIGDIVTNNHPADRLSGIDRLVFQLEKVAQ